MPLITLDAPVGGINAFDSPENMAPTDAIALDNWICRSGYVETIPGFSSVFGAGVDNDYERVEVYNGTTGVVSFVFKSTGRAYDIATYPIAGFITGGLFSSNTEDICTFHINGLMITVSGDVIEQSFNGTAFTDLDYTGSSPAIATSGAFTYGCNFKGRAIYINEGVNAFYYAEAGSYQGNISAFSLSSVAQRGGFPKHVAVWTMDTGTGPDDILVIYFSTGEVILYQGDDPGDIENWEIIGSFILAAPITKHASVKVGSDLILLSENGYVNLTDVLKVDQRSDYPAFSRRIWPMVKEIIEVLKKNGYTFTNENQAILWSEGFVLFNFAMKNGGTTVNYQFLVNVQTGAWSRWTGLAARWISEWDGYLYVGGGYIFTNEPSAAGLSIGSGDPSAIPAFTDLGIPDKKKHITAVQFNSTIASPVKIQTVGYSDFNIEGSIVTPADSSPSSVDETVIGTFPTVRRAMLYKTTKGWKNLHAYGYNVSMAVQMSGKPIYWRQYTYRYRLGQ